MFFWMADSAPLRISLLATSLASLATSGAAADEDDEDSDDDALDSAAAAAAADCALEEETSCGFSSGLGGFLRASSFFLILRSLAYLAWKGKVSLNNEYFQQKKFGLT